MSLKLNALLCLTIAFIIHSQRKHCQPYQSFLGLWRRAFLPFATQNPDKMRCKNFSWCTLKVSFCRGVHLVTKLFNFHSVNSTHGIRMRNQLQRRKYVVCVLISIWALFHLINRIRFADIQLCCIALVYLGDESKKPSKRPLSQRIKNRTSDTKWMLIVIGK